jgi:transcription elongation factor SPT6
VALARMALDPLAVLAALCGPGMEVASVSLHDCQDKLPREDLARAVEQASTPAAAAVAPWAGAAYLC